MNVNLHFGTADPERFTKEKRRTEGTKEAGLRDIAEAFARETPRFELDEVTVQGWTASLQETGLLFLSSLDCEVLDSAGQAIAARMAQEHEYCLFALRSCTIAEEDCVVNVEPLLRKKEGDSPAIVVVEAFEDHSELFLKSMIQTPRTLSRVASILRAIDRRLLILTRDRLLMTESRARFESRNRYIPYRYLSFLRPRLKERFPQDYLSLEDEILRQRGAGFWAVDEEPFYEQILDALDELRDRIKHNQEAGSSKAAAPPAREPEPSAQEPLVTACLFVAAFFPRLPVQDFNRLVPSLLDPVPRKDTSSSYKLSHGQGWMEEQPEPKSDRDLWRESYQEVLKKCQLAVQPVLGRPADGVCDTRLFIVDFQPPFAASKARETFLGLHYPLFLELVRRLREVKPSFLFDLVSDIAKNTASLILASAETNPGELQVGWLLQLLEEANSARRQALPQSEMSMDAESPKQEVEARQGPGAVEDKDAVKSEASKEPSAGTEAQEQEDKEKKGQEDKGKEEKEKEEKEKEQAEQETKRQVSYEHSFEERSPLPLDLKAREAAKGPSPPNVRVQDLLHEMMRRATLRDTVIRLLHELFSRRQIGDLIELTWSLRDVERFDAFKWWERLLNEGSKPARNWVYSKILRMARNGEGTDVVPAIRAWLPEPKALPLSLSSIAALYFYVDLNAAYLFDPRRRRQGWPPSHPVLSTLAGTSDGESEGLIRWLFHPGLAPILEPRAEDHFQEWILFWLVPEPLLPVFFDERHEDCRSALSLRWVEAWKTLLACECEESDTFLFPALVLADWAVELLGEDAPASEARSLLDRLLASLVSVCDLERRRALEVLWTAVEESLLDLLVFLEQLDPRPADLDKATAAEVRRNLQNRRRCVKQLRCDLQARSRMAKVN